MAGPTSFLERCREAAHQSAERDAPDALFVAREKERSELHRREALAQRVKGADGISRFGLAERVRRGETVHPCRQPCECLERGVAVAGSEGRIRDLPEHADL